MSSIHLIERSNNFTQLDDKTWESGFWALSEQVAKKLTGGSIFFHKKQAEPSFFGGIILGHRVQDQGTCQGRIIFKFHYFPDHRKVKTDRARWRNEMKILGV